MIILLNYFIYITHWQKNIIPYAPLVQIIISCLILTLLFATINMIFLIIRLWNVPEPFHFCLKYSLIKSPHSLFLCISILFYNSCFLPILFISNILNSPLCFSMFSWVFYPSRILACSLKQSFFQNISIACDIGITLTTLYVLVDIYAENFSLQLFMYFSYLIPGRKVSPDVFHFFNLKWHTNTMLSDRFFTRQNFLSFTNFLWYILAKL